MRKEGWKAGKLLLLPKDRTSHQIFNGQKHSRLPSQPLHVFLYETEPKAYHHIALKCYRTTTMMLLRRGRQIQGHDTPRYSTSSGTKGGIVQSAVEAAAASELKEAKLENRDH